MSRYNYNKFVYKKQYNEVTGDECEDNNSAYPLQPTTFNENLPKTTTYDHYIKISSGARDTTAYPLHYNYRINFETPFKNIKSIEMVSCVIPSTDISTEPLIIFDIEELNYVQYPTQNRGVKRIFASFPISEPNFPGHSFVNLKADTSKLVYKTPLASLSSLTIKLYDVDYNFLTFGSANGSTLKSLQHSFLLKITVVESNNAALKQRTMIQNQ